MRGPRRDPPSPTYTIHARTAGAGRRGPPVSTPPPGHPRSRTPPGPAVRGEKTNLARGASTDRIHMLCAIYTFNIAVRVEFMAPRHVHPVRQRHRREPCLHVGARREMKEVNF